MSKRKDVILEAAERYNKAVANRSSITKGDKTVIVNMKVVVVNR